MRTAHGFIHILPLIGIIAALTAGIILFTPAKKVLQLPIPSPSIRPLDAEALKLLQDLKKKETDYKEKGATSSALGEGIPEIIKLITDFKNDEAKMKIASLSALLDDTLAKKLEADRIASEAAKKKAEEAARKKAAEEAAKKAAIASAQATTAAPVTGGGDPPPGSGYARITVGTDVGNFTVDVVTADVGSTRVITDAGVSENCDNNCGTASLSDYISRNGGFAGINGSYFCPPDYANCDGKTNTFSWFVFNNRTKTFVNADKRDWGNAGGLYVFRGGSLQFFNSPTDFGLDTNITGAIASWPKVIIGGTVNNDPSMDDKQRNTKGTRGGMCNNGNTLRLLIARNATVLDLGYIMKGLGCTNGINLDGGGSSALYYNGYKVGPGRALPNAIILAR